MRFRHAARGAAAGPDAGPDALLRRARALAPWYQNIEIAPGVFTKDLDGDSDIFSGDDIPAPLWRLIAPELGELTGLRVLDIGCNAGYMTFESRRLGAASVVGIDSNLGATTSFIEQARFCRDALGLEVDFREQSMFDPVPGEPFDVVLFCGVLYHLEDFGGALDRVARLAVPGRGRIVLETAVERVTQAFPRSATYLGDPTTFFVPSPGVLVELLRERGLRVELLRDLGTRVIAFLRAPAGVS